VNAVNKKARKASGRPYRAKNAYMWFYTKNFKELSKELTESGKNSKIGDIAKLCKEKYQKLNAEEKKEYTVLAEQDKLRYSTERKKYISHRKANVIITSFIRYSNDVRPAVRKENPKAKATDVAKIIGEMWRALDNSKKEKYHEAFKFEKEAKQEKK